MQEEKKALELLESDLGVLGVDDVVCTNCIKGFCPARTAAVYDKVEFVLCGAKKASQPVLSAWQERTGIELHIERPC